MSTKHTPGPWKAAFPIGNCPFVSNENQVIVQKVFPSVNKGDTDEARANASLIASAPDLLAALRATMQCLTMDSEMERDFAPEIKQARAAIARATE